MAYNEIRELLNRYWEGDTSLEEEALLRQFFAGHTQDLPGDLQEAQPLFRYFREEAEAEWPEVPLPAALRLQPVKAGPLQHWMKYAAVLLVALGLGYAARQFQERQQQLAPGAVLQDTFSDPQQALEETQKALQLLAKNLNRGAAQMQKLAYFNEAADKIREN